MTNLISEPFLSFFFLFRMSRWRFTAGTSMLRRHCLTTEKRWMNITFCTVVVSSNAVWLCNSPCCLDWYYEKIETSKCIAVHGSSMYRGKNCYCHRIHDQVSWAKILVEDETDTLTLIWLIIHYPLLNLLLNCSCLLCNIYSLTSLLNMIRGSLFKTLHKNNQVLDIRRRLRMALDVVLLSSQVNHFP